MSCQMFKGLPTSRLSKQVTRLNHIANYPGSALSMPSDIVGIDMVFKKLNKYGHMGARQFWKFNLPTIQFHNPNLLISVRRIDTENDQEARKVPAKLTLKFQDGKEKTIDCIDKHSSQILKSLTEISQATPVARKNIPLRNKNT